MEAKIKEINPVVSTAVIIEVKRIEVVSTNSRPDFSACIQGLPKLPIKVMKSFEVPAIRYIGDCLEVLDQRHLPDQENYLPVRHPDDMVEYIATLAVRGAPLIGVAAALALAQYAEKGASTAEIKAAEAKLRASRPTAVNLMWALDRMLATDLSADQMGAEAEAVLAYEIATCQKMAEHGARLITQPEAVLTHCNTGCLATPGIGTALGVIIEAHRQGKIKHVYVDETRPLLQGGRLTTWELERCQIPYTLLCDNMAASLMRAGKVDRVFVGSDRVAMNGDFANKIGTYGVAVLAKAHGVPFHGVAPISTVDKDCASGDAIPIEERKPEEVRGVAGSFGQVRWSPESASVYNPAFDVTPVEYVTSFILEVGSVSQAQLKQGKLRELVQ